jgi:hypothetical protein
MTFSYTVSEADTFTITHARHMATRVATDLKRIQRFYGAPSDAVIANYESELVQFIKADCLGNVTYGFRRNGAWIEPTLRYAARDLAGGTANDDDPGRIRPGADISNASFYSYLTYNNRWYQFSEIERKDFAKLLPFQRTGALEPAIIGYLRSDRTYSAGGRALDRASVRSY